MFNVIAMILSQHKAERAARAQAAADARCATCRFHIHYGYNYGCRRFPPTWVGQIQAQYPAVGGNDWCGEYKPKE